MIKILILTAPYGNGHLAVTKSLIDVFNKSNNIEYTIYDLYTEDYPTTTHFVKKFYYNTYKKGLEQQAYRFFYYGSDKILDLSIAKPYVRFGIKKLVKKINEVKPDLILNTFPVSATYSLCEENINIPVYTVITDYFANANWISKNTRKHFISSENVSKQLKIRGVKKSQYEITGIPIKPIFYEEFSKTELDELKNKFNIKDKQKVILIVAGAIGVVPNFNKIVEYFINEDNIKLLVVCGKNHKVYKKLFRSYGKLDNVNLYGFVNNIHEMMRVSDLLITKPGGITMTEAANIGIPVVLYRPVYGQELENAIYFSSNRAATIALQEDELVYKTLTILNDDELLKDMKNNIRKIAIKNSANLIFESLIEDYNKYLEELNESN